ncbi:MAG: hypothetical protein ABS36_03510 [Acidobacteria bacterium SCN 69-37]|nr:MAG: hypothetical protein ABS36_03510 [Acidobacteria bacterium SCN 69-37]
MRTRAALVTAVVLLAATLGFAQGGRFRGFDALRRPVTPDPGIAYDGRFTFVRLTYDTAPGGYWYRGQPAWMHGYPTAERNLMRIMDALTTLAPHVDEVKTLSLEDPAIFDYPVLYIIEVGWWMMTDTEAANLRAYIQKGGFVIVDDFKLPGGIGGGGWDHFAANMQRVLPDARFVDLDASHPIFHQFFDIPSFDIIPQAYNAGRPSFIGLHEDNDPARPLRMMVFYNTDISQYWEWSERGFRSIEETNEAYKLGVNAILYGLTH